MKIRRARKGDEEEIKEIVRKSLFEIFKVEPPQSVFEDLGNINKNYVLFYVAGDKNKVIGCAGLKIQRDIPRIKKMYLLKAYRRKGIGQALLDKLIRYCETRGHKKIVLSTTPEMKGAISFYKKNGFRKTRENKKKNMVFFEKRLK
ncbi:hypothetical protein A3K73_02800 [Candidatus Pacearchaeota archaeon RBG_13_36_9]|nr:MAG: hypothetical protein A3K73_02800 [Candidatus Pacearchaeota archaeon RBG_13_36_9]